jgi:hypothetical protein
MRSFLAFGLFIALSASAGAAAVHHFGRRHVTVSHRAVYPVSGWEFAAPRPPVRYYDDTPSYNDASKFGGGTAL